MAIHPAQVPVINAAFTPSPAAVARSHAIVRAFADAGNPGVVAIDGQMYDRPHLGGPSASWPGRQRLASPDGQRRQSASQRGRRIEKTSVTLEKSM